MKKKKKETRGTSLAARYGIAEWYGNDFLGISPEQRNDLALQAKRGTLREAPICPYLSTLIPGVHCNKKGGVCSIRPFSQLEDGGGIAVPDEKVVTTCPTRFLEAVKGHKSIFSWISKVLLEIDNPIVIKETPFLRSISDKPLMNNGEKEEEQDVEEEEKKAGRIDWILVNPNSIASSEIEWCAVETQALYFSGNKMSLEFDAYLKQRKGILYPTGKRRPDYRSSGPKRLSPQLDVKVPVLRNWGKKVAVVIDTFFFEQMAVLEDAFPRAKNDRERRDNADVIWFIVDYDSSMNLFPEKVVFSTLDSSRKALNAAEPLSKGDFTDDLRKMIEGKAGKALKVFKL